MVELSPVELKLLRLILDAGAQSGELENARCKLRESLAKRGLSSHDVVEALTNPGDAQVMAPPKMSRPDYGLCRMPFGRTKGQLFMDVSPSDLRGAVDWAKRTDPQKFARFIHDGEAFLTQ
jgi:hypothetical protein